ncbi:hypothetical protein H6F96_19650 [Microcoleus sp. FACHB-53]|nr:hypothetical protein [Microcoleus sp. FACHB-53]
MTEDNKVNGGKLALITLEGLEFENDFGQSPIGLGHFSKDQGFIAVASLVGFFIGCAVTGNVLAGVLVIVAGLNDIGYAKRKPSTPTPDPNGEEPAIDVEASVVDDSPKQIGEATKLLAVDVPVEEITSDRYSEVTTPEVMPTVFTQPQVAQTQTSTKLTPQAPDIALEMASVPKSTIIAASPRVGKGVVVSMAIAHLQQLHPDLEIWLIDPKDEPTERHYWSGIDSDKRCHFDLRDFDVDVEGAISAFSDLLTRFNRSQSHRKLLIIDEFVTLNQKCAGSFMNQLKDFVVGICSSGEVNPDMGIGRFVWAITQSPYVSDLGFKTKAALATFQRIFLLNKPSVHLYALAVSASFVPSGAEQKINRLLEPTGRIFYYSRTDSWHPIPNYDLPQLLTDSSFREKGQDATEPTSEVQTKKEANACTEPTAELKVSDSLAEPLKTIWLFAKKKNDWITVRNVYDQKFKVLSGKKVEQIHQYLGLLADSGLGEIDEEGKSHSAVGFRAY